MAVKNLEEALVERIQRSIAKELRRLWRAPLQRRNGHAPTQNVGPARRKTRELDRPTNND